MVLALLQRRSNPSMATPPSVSQADFTRWLYELYEGTENQTEQTSSGSTSKRGKPIQSASVSGLITSTFFLDFATSTECMDTGTDPIIQSPNISHEGHVTPIRLPSKPKERKRKSKKRKAAATPKPIAKRKCLEMETNNELEVEREQTPETAIQFLSNLETFNMANCDNLEMELDEEELYLLQLTSNAKQNENKGNVRVQDPDDLKSPAQTSKFPKSENHLPAVLKETASSLKGYDEKQCPFPDKTEELMHKKTFEIQENIGSLTELPPNIDISAYPVSMAEVRIVSSNKPSEMEVNASGGTDSHLDKSVSNLDTGSMSLFGSDSDVESEYSIEQMAPELSDSDDTFDNSEEDCRSADEPSNSKK